MGIRNGCAKDIVQYLTMCLSSMFRSLPGTCRLVAQVVLEVVVVVQEFARHVSVGGTGGLRSRRRCSGVCQARVGWWHRWS